MESAPRAGARIRRSSVIVRDSRPAVGLAFGRSRSALDKPAVAVAEGGGRRRTAGYQSTSQGRMATLRSAATAVLVVVTMQLSACATPEARDIGGRWRPVGQFAETPRAIPLQQAYVYQASPADGTLKVMLERWARDSRMALSYQHPNDYTLHVPVADIRTTSLEQATDALSSAYAGHGVRVASDEKRIVVSQLPPGEQGR